MIPGSICAKISVRHFSDHSYVHANVPMEANLDRFLSRVNAFLHIDSLLRKYEIIFSLTVFVFAHILDPSLCAL